MSRKPRWLAGFAAIIIAVAMTLVGGVPANAGKERPDSLGKEFWVAFPSNYSSMTPTLSLFISSPDATNGTVAIPGLPWSEDFSVTTGAVTTVQIPAAAQLSLGDSGAVENRGIKVTAADEVTVYGLNRIQATTDAYLGLPVDVLGTEHLVLGWPDLMGQLRSEFAVLASQDGTDVTYVPNAKTTSGTDVGVAKTVTLNAGEALPVSSLSGDLSGSEVTSTKPVALFGGHECTFIPDENTWACDHLVEQIPPTSTWGKEFLTVPLKTRKGGDTFRMLASEDGTSVSVNGAVVATLDRGQVHQQLIDGKSTVSADKPILVAQHSNGSDFDGVTSDPFMMLVPPTEQFLSEYTFATPATGFAQNFVNVVTPTAAIGGLVLDGAAVPPGEFSQIGSTAFSGAQLDLTAGSHSMTSKEPFGIYVYGFDFYDSYGYPGGAAYAPINEVTALTMTPPTQKVLVNTEACVDTKVTDQFGDPLAGIQLAMTVSGVNPGTGDGLTEASGVAKYCYTGTQVGIDTVKATFGELSASATIEWTEPVVSPTPTPTVKPAKAKKLPINAKKVHGQPAALGADGKVMLTKSIKTNKHGKLAVRAFCTPTSPSAAGEVRFCDITVSKKGKVTVRSTGYDSLKVVVKAKATPKKGQEDLWLPNKWRKAWKIKG
ncbi:MAG: hypothetical protein H6528_10700 [Actinobacteria bacterium]|nr:hypothetical protein [Actinomycetota bacterium]MCB8997754.1 hypothetical protein [Actinomycetota bacterium]